MAGPDHYVDFRKRKSTELWECNEAAIQKSSPRGSPLVKLTLLLLVFLREAALADVFYWRVATIEHFIGFRFFETRLCMQGKCVLVLKGSLEEHIIEIFFA